MLIDTHVHMALNGTNNRNKWENLSLQQKKLYIKKTFESYRNHNVCGIRDGGDRFLISYMAREIAEEEGIIYKTPIYALYKKGYYGNPLGRPIDNMKDFEREFNSLLEYKLDHLKLIVTGIVNFKKYGDVGEITFNIDELKYMVQMAKLHNIPTMVHANGKEGVKAAIKAGADTIEHGYLISEEELYSMEEHNVIWVPTLSPLGNILDSHDHRFVKEREVIKRIYNRQLESIKRGLEIGVKIALGSDAGAYRVEHGIGLLDEMKHFEEIGLDKDILKKMCAENGKAVLGL